MTEENTDKKLTNQELAITATLWVTAIYGAYRIGCGVENQGGKLVQTLKAKKNAKKTEN